MEPTPRHHAAETRFRELVANAELASPDNVEYTPDTLVFRWEGPKVAVVVELDDVPSSAAQRV